MFITVKNLTAYMDNTIKYFNEGIASKEQHDEETFFNWYVDITKTMQGQLRKLKEISNNQKLITKYETIINELLSTPLTSL